MFSEDQKKAIAFYKGPAIVIAGPGSGKTTVITHRVKNLINEHRVNPENILVVTYTKAAAENMKLRFKNLMAGRSLPVSFGTFHSVFFRILRTEKNYQVDSLLTDSEKINIIKELVIRHNIDVQSQKDFVMSMLDEISIAKGNEKNVYDYEPVVCDKELFFKIYDEYEKEKDYENKLDFEDMLRLCYELFLEKSSLLEKWQKVFEFVLVDEFQDINRLQFEIVKMISKPENNIFIVGDDDQSIYGFRGSRPELMFEFEDYYKDATRILLTNNYRSLAPVVKASSNLISHNIIRFDKDIKSLAQDGNDVDVRVFKSAKDEIVGTCKMIKEYIKRGVDAKEIGVLVRNNSMIPIIKSIFESMELETEAKFKKSSISSTLVFKDIIMYLKCALSFENGKFTDEESLMYILNKPNRLIGREVVIDSGFDMDKVKKVYAKSSEIVRNISDFEFHMQMIKKLDPFGAVNYIKNVTGYEKYLAEYAVGKNMPLSRLKKQLEDVQIESGKYASIEAWIDSIEKEEEQREPLDAKNLSKSRVNIMTMHRSKGLEFKVVFILSVNQGIIPSSRATRSQDFEEERRVFYVAMTRAKEYLHIFLVGESLGFPVEPSMFLHEIKDEEVQ